MCHTTTWVTKLEVGTGLYNHSGTHAAVSEVCPPHSKRELKPSIVQVALVRNPQVVR